MTTRISYVTRNAAFLLLLGMGCEREAAKGMSSARDLISASNNGMRISQVSPSPRLSAIEADRYVRGHADRSAFHLLMYLRRQAPDACDAIPPETRAKILCDSLSHAQVLNDFGYLEPLAVGAAGRELVGLGEPAIPYLVSLLCDTGLAPVFGSEEALKADTLVYRRCDYAYVFVMLILDRPFEFSDTPAARDVLIEEVRRELDYVADRRGGRGAIRRE